MWTVLIIDSESPARESIKQLMLANNEWRIIGEVGDSKAALPLIEEFTPHLIILDIELPRLDGLSLLHQLKHKPLIIFTTTTKNFALQAFDEDATDCLLKPFTDERFYRAIHRATTKIKEQEAQKTLADIQHVLGLPVKASVSEKKITDTISVSIKNRILLIPLTEIIWIGSSGNYSELHTPDRTYLHTETLTAIDKRINPDEFMRINRSYIVNRKHVKELKKHSNGEYFVILDNNQALKLSRSFRHVAKEILGIF